MAYPSLANLPLYQTLNDILHLNGGNAGLTGSLINVYDGAGNKSALAVSTSAAQINGYMTIAPAGATGTVPPSLTITTAGNTALTASTGRNEVKIDLQANTQVWAAGSWAEQDFIYVT